ncbi:Tau-tubulin kinase 1 [Toxocara canis]|uniref:Tau-tubulin kinase 1 n=1 Tax=Toxocara canis TaxID=6265 RepID=A0A0B2V176_TOXCA|nr:Tau-tubulin kinase 1 [Toxocara canis]
MGEASKAKAGRRKRSSKAERHYKQRIRDEDELLVQSGSIDDFDDDDDVDLLKKARKKERLRKEVKKKVSSSTTRAKLPAGVVINTDRNRYEILAVLGAGGFGDVYKVRQLDSQDITDIFALKTESSGPDGKQINRLKVEMNILQLCWNVPDKEKQHFVRMVDKGRTDTFKFIVMDLVGESIDNIQRRISHRRFSMATCINLGLQTLEGISDLHALGYLHRDIKPQNFTSGLREKSETIFLLDFGIARRYVEKDSKAIRLPREIVRFLGTVRFASRNCHRSREQCRRDDLESWAYMLFEFTDCGALPWCRTVDRKVVCREKEKLFSGTFTKHIANLPEEFHKILFYIDELNYESTPDYDYIAKLLKRAAARRNVNLTEKFDWIRIIDDSDSSDRSRSDKKKGPSHSNFKKGRSKKKSHELYDDGD